MIKLGIISDLHLEFRPNLKEWDRLADTINNCGADLILNAGDIHPNPEMRIAFMNRIKLPEYQIDKDHKIAAYQYILGNHDFYGHQEVQQSHFSSKKLGIFGATLWTDFMKNDKEVMLRFANCLADGWQITPRKSFNSLADELLQLHKSDLQAIAMSQASVVVTHHAPSFKSVHKKFHHTGFLNYYFMSDLDQFILDHPHIKLWIHGHMHDPSDYMIGNCRVIANPLGYPGERHRSVEQYKPVIVGV